MDNYKACKGLGDIFLVFFPDFEKDKEFYESDDFYECENKICSNETHDLTCGLVANMIPFRACHVSNSME